MDRRRRRRVPMRKGLATFVVATIAVDTVSGWVRRRIIEGAGEKRMHDEAFEEPSFAGAAVLRRVGEPAVRRRLPFADTDATVTTNGARHHIARTEER